MQLYLIPVVSVIGGVLILQEQVTVLVVLGAAVTLVAIALVRKNDQQRRRYSEVSARTEPFTLAGSSTAGRRR